MADINFITKEHFDSESNRLEQLIDSEANRAIKAENYIVTLINSESSDLVYLINSEAERAMNAEKLLKLMIDSEADRAETVEGYIINILDSEAQRAMNAENNLTILIDSESNRAQIAEQNIIQYVDSEDAYIINLIDSEANRAVKSEKYILNLVDSEAVRATNKEKYILSLLNSEAVRAKKEESRLQDEIDDIGHGGVKPGHGLKFTSEGLLETTDKGTLTIFMNSEGIGSFDADSTDDVDLKINVPTKLSQLEDDMYFSRVKFVYNATTKILNIWTIFDSEGN